MFMVLNADLFCAFDTIKHRKTHNSSWQAGTKGSFMKSFKLWVVGCLLLGLPFTIFAQKKHWEASATFGAMNYYGDLTAPFFTIKEIRAGGQFSLRRYFDREHALRLNVMYGSLSGADHNFDRNYLRNNSFDGKMTEIAFLGEKDFKGQKRFSSRHGYQKMSSLYMYAGASVGHFDPTVTYGNPDSGDKKIDYIKWHLGMPVGGGLRVDLNQKIVLEFEVSYRFTISDFLDGTQASGNAYKNDGYTFGGVSLGYRLFDKEKPAVEKKTKAQLRAEGQQ